MRNRKRALVLVCAVLAAFAFALISNDSSADKSFTLRMEEDTRKDWDKSFNKLLAEPFENLTCKSGAGLSMPLGNGCVDAGDHEICCSSWKVWLNCKSGAWTQGDIDGGNCSKKAKPKSE